MTLIIYLVFSLVLIYSIDYLNHDLNSNHITKRQLINYYERTLLFVASMILVTFINNIGLMWAGLEATTLISALLVGFYNTRESTEAAWKYLIICTVALALSLFGIIIFNYAIISTNANLSLDYSILMQSNQIINIDIIKLAFIFILIGYSTKAGLAPMHTWLPDAHSQSPAPISALLSGLLLACSTYALIRVSNVFCYLTATNFVANYFLGFGLLSLFIAFPFIILQNDIKRLMAYSSIEHIGIIYIAIGVGGKLGIIASLYHIFYHAIIKSLMFLLTGIITSIYNTTQIIKFKNLFSKYTLLSIIFLLSGLGLCGLPPFGLFFSELMICIAFIQKHYYISCMLYLLILMLIFIGFTYKLTQIIFAKNNITYEAQEKMLIFKSDYNNLHKIPFKMKFSITILFIIAFISGIFVTQSLNNLILNITLILKFLN